jgi:hypothetical protein
MVNYIFIFVILILIIFMVLILTKKGIQNFEIIHPASI